MKPDKDRPSTWVRYQNGMCEGCSAGCCTMPVEVHFSDLVRLGLTDQDERANSSEKKIAKRLIKEGVLKEYRMGTGLFMLTQKSNDDCYYLHEKTRLCTVYDRRPEVCRSFPRIGPRPGYCPQVRSMKR